MEHPDNSFALMDSEDHQASDVNQDQAAAAALHAATGQQPHVGTAPQYTVIENGQAVAVPINEFQNILQVNSNMNQQMNQQQQQIAQLLKAVTDLTAVNRSNAANSNNSNISEWKIPNAKPPTFDGKCRHKNAHEAQIAVDDYLHKAREEAFFHGFLADGETPVKTNHRTYVQWLSTGLTLDALKKWRNIAETSRHGMTFANYSTWIRSEFVSPLSLQQAIIAKRKLVQTGSCSNYIQQFNDLISAITSHSINLDVKYLCYEFRLGLKPHLQTDEDLFQINSDLKQLQDEAERKDDFFFRQSKDISNTKGKSANTPQRFPKLSPTSTSTTKADPMQLDAITSIPSNRLTEEQKIEYRRNGWCTFCRSKEHSYPDCDAPGKRHQSPRTKINNTEQSEGPSVTDAVSQEFQEDHE